MDDLDPSLSRHRAERALRDVVRLWHRDDLREGDAAADPGAPPRASAAARLRWIWLESG